MNNFFDSSLNMIQESIDYCPKFFKTMPGLCSMAALAALEVRLQGGKRQTQLLVFAEALSLYTLVAKELVAKESTSTLKTITLSSTATATAAVIVDPQISLPRKAWQLLNLGVCIRAATK